MLTDAIWGFVSIIFVFTALWTYYFSDAASSPGTGYANAPPRSEA